ncbi:unnamed protein product [Linum tenue]|uniref:Uncharacterized protein n=1 Tax=Linum tenue TaxID=586396 RepID=A0AAV0L300_9ROSI|nr:unnamed protein product [Linum tenue]
MDGKRSWTCTLVTQLCLCVALYLALNIGEPQQQQPWQRLPRRPGDVVVFVTIEDVVRIYGARFVVNFSELGEEDPLTRNASQLFKSSSIPWYTTKASKGQEIASCFKEHIKIDNRQTFNMIGLNTGSLLDLLLTESMNGSGDGQNWLGSTLEAANGSICGMADGFLLHRVTSLEMITYSISSEGKVLSRFVTQQKGKAAI